mmetsp:Transcript_2345/g.3360  ORF Transcript_2345/g.3360 Transcript_2345/m.3360 type:complete len:140 (-) Transcript_2345:116-535(-)
MTELRRSERVRQSTRGSDQYNDEVYESVSVLANKDFRAREWHKVEAKVIGGSFRIKKWVPKNQPNPTPELHEHSKSEGCIRVRRGKRARKMNASKRGGRGGHSIIHLHGNIFNEGVASSSMDNEKDDETSDTKMSELGN